MKDVVVCDKSRGADNQALIRGCPNGETRRMLKALSALSMLRRRKTEKSALRRSINLLSVIGPLSEQIKHLVNTERFKHAPYRAEFIGSRTRTQGTETSKYLEEKKSTEIPLVVASERGTAEQPALVECSGKYSDTR